MRGLRQEWIPELVAKDVAVVKKEAAMVICLNGGDFEIIRNPEPRLNVIAVIGPGEAFGEKFNEALLCEIGIGQSRPYHEAKTPRKLRRHGESISISARRKWFYLSDEQYQQAAPITFSVLQEMTNHVVLGWKKGIFGDDPWWIVAEESFFLKSRKKTKVREKSYAFPKGTRYVVSLEDRPFLFDVFSAELETNRGRLECLWRYIDKRLSGIPPRKKKGRPKAFADVDKALDKKYLHRYFKLEVVRRFSSHRFFDALCASIDWNGDDVDTDEHRLIEAALPDLSSRLNGIRLTVTTGLDRKKDHIVFEVLPSGNGVKPPLESEILSGDDSLLDAVPF